MAAGSLQELKADEVHVRAFRLDCVELTSENSAVLSAEEALRALKIQSVHNAEQFAKSRIQLRRTLSSYLGIAPENIRLERSPAGKPLLRPEQSRGLNFNLSHSGNRVLIAIGVGQELGVDLEEEREGPNFDGIAGRFFTPEEKTHYFSSAGPDRSAVFYSLWTRKEALAKARGTGVLSGGPWPFKPWRFHTFKPAQGYTASVCCERGRIRFFN